MTVRLRAGPRRAHSPWRGIRILRAAIARGPIETQAYQHNAERTGEQAPFRPGIQPIRDAAEDRHREKRKARHQQHCIGWRGE